MGNRLSSRTARTSKPNTERSTFRTLRAVRQRDKGPKEFYWPYSLLKRFVKPAAIRAKITKRVGWHMLRHTYSTLLRANGTDIKVQQELLRHSNVQTTLQIYTQAISEEKRAANAKVVGQLLTMPQRESA